MLFTDNIVLVDKTKIRVNCWLKLWRSTLKSKDLRLNRNKIKCIEYNFSKIRNKGEDKINKN